MPMTSFRKNHAKHSNHGEVPNWPGRSNASFPRWTGKFCRTSTVAIREFFGETGAHWTRRKNPYMTEENEKEPWSSVQWNKVGTRWKMGTLEDKKKCVLGFQTLCEVKFGPPKTYPQPPNRPLSTFSEGKITLNLAVGSQLVAGFFAWGVQPSARCVETTIDLHLLLRCLEEVPKTFSPKWWWKMVMNPMGSESLKNHQKNNST